jgi:hypothetical protein
MQGTELCRRLSFPSTKPPTSAGETQDVLCPLGLPELLASFSWRTEMGCPALSGSPSWEE